MYRRRRNAQRSEIAFISQPAQSSFESCRDRERYDTCSKAVPVFVFPSYRCLAPTKLVMVMVRQLLAFPSSRQMSDTGGTVIDADHQTCLFRFSGVEKGKIRTESRKGPVAEPVGSGTLQNTPAHHAHTTQAAATLVYWCALCHPTRTRVCRRVWLVHPML